MINRERLVALLEEHSKPFFGHYTSNEEFADLVISESAPCLDKRALRRWYRSTVDDIYAILCLADIKRFFGYRQRIYRLRTALEWLKWSAKAEGVEL